MGVKISIFRGVRNKIISMLSKKRKEKRKLVVFDDVVRLMRNGNDILIDSIKMFFVL